MLERLDERANKRIAGPGWDKIRPQLERIHRALASVSPTAWGELTTIYVKYGTKETGSQPYAVLWIKKSTELILGLALAEEYPLGALTPLASQLKYAGLTVYLGFDPQTEVPDLLSQWAQDAYAHVRSTADVE